VPDLPISKLSTCLGPQDSGPPKVKKTYHSASALRKTWSRGGLAIWATPGGPQGVGSYVTIGWKTGTVDTVSYRDPECRGLL